MTSRQTSLDAETSPPRLRTFSQRLKHAPDFPTACYLAAARYRLEARRLVRECHAAGLPGDGSFWLDAAKDAERAAALFTRCRKLGETPEEIAGRLRDEALRPFDAALRTGNYAEYLGL